jgi:hypothetical protein
MGTRPPHNGHLPRHNGEKNLTMNTCPATMNTRPVTMKTCHDDHSKARTGRSSSDLDVNAFYLRTRRYYGPPTRSRRVRSATVRFTNCFHNCSPAAGRQS